MAYNIQIQKEIETLNVDFQAGEILFVLGANGTGKSSLMHRFYARNHMDAHRISAHRQTWFESNAITLSPHQKRNTEQNIKARGVEEANRWKDDYSSTRASLAIYDLIDAENVRARGIAHAVDLGNVDVALELAKKDAPIKIINELLRLSNIPILISVLKNEQVVASKDNGPPYSIAELSDGERNAILIAADVLTVPANTLILIDEPERHLHRSIISPLLTQLFAQRPDCGFVISTHEVMLPLDNPTSKILLIRGCLYNGSSVLWWDADLSLPEELNDENIKKDILGARRKVIFIEGEEQSLDKSLYSLVFPNVSIIPKSSCKDVEYVVTSIRSAQKLHWVMAYGIIDKDNRTPGEVEALTQQGIYPISSYSVESIYYHPSVQEFIADRHASLLGTNAAEMLSNANHSLLESIIPNKTRLASRAAEKKIRTQIFSNLPTQRSVSDSIPVNIQIDTTQVVADEVIALDALISASDVEGIISKYPIRETPALNQIAVKLGFVNRKQYEQAVRKLLLDNKLALDFVRGLFGALQEDLNR